MAYLAVGYICWLFMQNAVNTGCMAIIQAKPMLSKIVANFDFYLPSCIP